MRQHYIKHKTFTSSNIIKFFFFEFTFQFVRTCSFERVTETRSLSHTRVPQCIRKGFVLPDIDSMCNPILLGGVEFL